MKKGDTIRLKLYGHNQDCSDDCPCGGDHMVRANVVEVLKDGFFRAQLADEEHPLYSIDSTNADTGLSERKVRVLTCSPDMVYEATK